jgi:4-diphosphocytidyl-2-C-methyl-D-erythritol kinase
MPVHRRAFAKVNLLLSVGAPEPADAAKAGWHQILSWFHAIDLADELTLERATTSIATSSSFDIQWAPDAPRPSAIDWPLEADLSVRAHAALQSAIGKPLPVRMTLRKRIPVGGGLGGGSSDAAAMLLALRELYALDISDDALGALGASLGSDVSYFLDAEPETAPRPAIVAGFGDEIERLNWGLSRDLVLVVPPYSCPTPAVYQAFDAQLRERQALDRQERARRGITGPEKSWGPRDTLLRSRVAKGQSLENDDLFNDLAQPAFAVEPQLGALVTSLSRGTRMQAHVTGSGSCVFQLPQAGKTDWLMERVQRVLAQSGPDARAVVVKLVG